MAVSISIPKLGMTMSEAKLVEWRAKEGDWIEKGNTVLTIETEKLSYEIDAPASGYLHILIQPDVTVSVGEVVGFLAETKEEFEQLQKEHPKAIEETESQAEVIWVSQEQPSTDSAGQVKISPAARKLAEIHQIDFTQMVGSGPGGRIVREDIEKAIAKKEVKVSEPITSDEGKKAKATIPLKGMRKAIAEHMQRSLNVSAQITTMGEYDMTEMVKFRKALLEREKIIGLRISYTDLFVFILARALRENLAINSSLIGNEMIIWENINIGVAVALEGGDFEGGLIVPVVKDADKKSLLEIGRIVKELVIKARNNELMPDDLSSGTFTLTNVGGFGLGWSFSTPIINQPQTAILRTSEIVERPAVQDGQLVIRPIVAYSLTYDHRLLDAAPAARFLLTLKDLIENPILLTV